MNVFSQVWASLKHLATQARRLGDALGSMAEQVEQRSLEVVEPDETPVLTNGKPRVTKVSR